MQSLQYKNLCKAVLKKEREEKIRPKQWVKSTIIKVRNEITQGTAKWKIVILSYCAVVL